MGCTNEFLGEKYTLLELELSDMTFGFMTDRNNEIFLIVFITTNLLSVQPVPVKPMYRSILLNTHKVSE